MSALYQLNVLFGLIIFLKQNDFGVAQSNQNDDGPLDAWVAILLKASDDIWNASRDQQFLADTEANRRRFENKKIETWRKYEHFKKNPSTRRELIHYLTVQSDEVIPILGNIIDLLKKENDPNDIQTINNLQETMKLIKRNKRKVEKLEKERDDQEEEEEEEERRKQAQSIEAPQQQKNCITGKIYRALDFLKSATGWPCDFFRKKLKSIRIW